MPDPTSPADEPKWQNGDIVALVAIGIQVHRWHNRWWEFKGANDYPHEVDDHRFGYGDPVLIWRCGRFYRAFEARNRVPIEAAESGC